MLQRMLDRLAYSFHKPSKLYDAGAVLVSRQHREEEDHRRLVFSLIGVS